MYQHERYKPREYAKGEAGGPTSPLHEGTLQVQILPLSLRLRFICTHGLLKQMGLTPLGAVANAGSTLYGN